MCDKKWEKMLEDGDFQGNPILSYIYHSIVQNSNVEVVTFKPYEYLRIKVNNIIYEISLIKKKNKFIIDSVSISYTIVVPYSKKNMEKRYPGQFIRFPNKYNIKFSGYKLYQFTNAHIKNSLLQEIVYFTQKYVHFK